MFVNIDLNKNLFNARSEIKMYKTNLQLFDGRWRQNKQNLKETF